MIDYYSLITMPLADLQSLETKLWQEYEDAVENDLDTFIELGEDWCLVRHELRGRERDQLTGHAP